MTIYLWQKISTLDDLNDAIQWSKTAHNNYPDRIEVPKLFAAGQMDLPKEIDGVPITISSKHGQPPDGHAYFIYGEDNGLTTKSAT
jgi:hypothetical protein